MKKRYIHILLFLSLVTFFVPTFVTAQVSNQQKKEKITVESVVNDEKGNPVMGATVFGNEGTVIAKTDALGKFTITVPDQTDLLVEAPNFESAVFKYGEYGNSKVLVLKTTPLLYGNNDNINIAFKKIKKGDLVNAVSVYNPSDFAYFDATQSIADVISLQIPGLWDNANIRGYGSGTALTLVDGLPRDLSTIKLSEVAQITVMKDMNSALLYGSPAVNGVILVTTKRGQPHKKEVNVTGYYGVSKPKALPDYLSSAQFMTLFNEARVNDGLAPLYTPTDLTNYTSGNPYRYPSVDYYSSQYLKSVKPFFSAISELSGGNDNAQYYANLGWDQTGNLINFGSAKDGHRNRFNARGNVDLKINDWVKSSLDVVGIFDNTLGPTGADYWQSAATLRPNLFAPLLPIDLIYAKDPSLVGHKNDVDGLYMLGGTSSYQTNSIASIYSGGTNTNVKRTFQMNNRIDFDLGKLVQGLSLHTNVSFDFYSTFDQSTTNTYATYLPTWSATADSITKLTKYGSDTRPGTQAVQNGYYERRIGFYGLLDYNRTFSDVHTVGASLVLYGTSFNWTSNVQPLKNEDLALRLNYAFKKKYLVDFSSSMVNSIRLPKANRRAISPSLGVAWVISSEDFLSSVTAINYLKLKASVANVKSDAGITGQNNGFFLWDNKTALSGYWYWDEQNFNQQGLVSNYGGNPNLTWEKRKELNIGIEGILFNNLLSFDGNVFTSQYYDKVTQCKSLYPSFFTDFIPYTNNDNYAYRGAEFGLSLHKKINDVTVVVGANALYATSKILKKDELWNNAYQYRTGKPVDAIFGLVSEGLFSSTDDIKNSPQQMFGTVHPGDIKYVDQNGDHVVDANDVVQIGRSQAPFSYGLNVKVSYKNLSLYARGTGRTGANGMKGSGNTYQSNYYWVFGSNVYSSVVLNRWTPETAATATYPRLSSVSNPNDFQASSYWLYDNSYFRLDLLQLSYDMPQMICSKIAMKSLSIFVNGSGLATFAKNKNILDLNIGAEPYYRSFEIGIKTAF